MEVTVEKLIYGGYGLAHQDGRVLLIPFAAPGDRLLVRSVQEKKNYVIAHIERVIEASPQRRVAHCPYFQICGGCQLQHLTYDAQREAKLGFLKESFSRIGGIDWPHDIQFIYGPEFNYRLRAQLKLKTNDSGVYLGYFKPESHELCEVTSCPLLSPTLNQALERLRQLPASQFDGVQSIDLVQGLDEQVASHPAVGLSESEGVILSVGEFQYYVKPQSFFQVNRFLLEQMLKLVGTEEHGRSALDLYCGVGFFTLPLAQRFERTIGVESDPHAIRLALRNTRLNQVRSVQLVTASVEKWLEKKGKLGDELDFVLVDPPRMGLTRKIISSLIRLCPARLTYVSCNPTTLARDLKYLLTGGYRLSSLTAIDLFPQTYHIEAVAKLHRY